VELAPASARNQIDNPTTGAAELGWWHGGDDAELLNRIGRWAPTASYVRADVGVTYAVHQEVDGVAARTIDIVKSTIFV